MQIYIFIIMFILGTILGSFYNVIGYRLPKNESIVKPASHCPKCNTPLTMTELIPILSFFICKGKCRHCQNKISWFYPIFEFLTGLLFGILYLIYGLTPDIIIPITFISMLIIIVISDYNYMIISDNIIIIFGILLSIEIFLINDMNTLISSLISAVLAFLTMYGIKLFGNFLFKKESMGDGDIKLLAIFGLVLGYPMAIMSIFIGAIIGFPISLLMLKNNKDHIIPFGPFLALGAIIIIITKLDINTIINLLNSWHFQSFIII